MAEMPESLKKAIPHDVRLYVRNFWRHPNDKNRTYDFYDTQGEEFLYYLASDTGPLNPENWNDIVVLLFARGCLKTTTCTMIANWALDCYPVEGLVTAPRRDQTQEVMDRFEDAAEESGLDQRETRGKKTHKKYRQTYTDEAGQKRTTYSQIKSRSSWGEGDALRGIHAHFGIVDEFQDVDEGMFSVFLEAIDQSVPDVEYFPTIFVIGTPKMANSFFNTLWDISDKREWNDEEKTWESTDEAISYLPPELQEEVSKINGQIEALEASDEDHSDLIRKLKEERKKINDRGFSVTGWHIDQHACPLHSETQIAFKKATYTKRKYKNEVKAEFYTPENDLLTEGHVREAFSEDEGWYSKKTDPSHETFIGVDWGGGDSEGASSTEITVFEAQADGRLKVLKHSFLDHDLTDDEEIRRVEEYIMMYDPTVVVVDEGYGDTKRNNLQQGVGTKYTDNGYDMVFGCHYGNVNKKDGLTWNRKGKKDYFTVNRTFMIENFADDFKKGAIIIPAKDLDFGSRNATGDRLMRELSAPYTDRVETPDGKRKLKVLSDKHDDAFHAFTFAWIAANFVKSRRQVKGVASHKRRGH